MPQSESKTSFYPGDMVQTGNPTDVALKSDGFFELTTHNRMHLYTRDGEFHINADNILVNKQGFEVSGESGTITLTPGKGEIFIDSSGKIFQGGIPLSQLAVYKFNNRDALQQVSGGFILPRDGSIKPISEDEPEILQGYIEGSNVSAIQEMVNLVTVSHAYDANQKVISHYDQQLDRTIQALGDTR